MADFTVRTAQQLPALLHALRKDSGLTQAAVATRLGITQQAYSAMERNADTVGFDRLLQLLSILGAELVLRQGGKPASSTVSTGPNW
ncbi:helix-turn-helix domain-containing protein [Achromobacter sp. GG226]|uniref:helix-turn-helix domain-containing protein n=1 Tax=Verticiella alkaliphila TaxID=2779529 RepID=UPI001C0C5B18|nr:helix-turn-helix domain-containing protein [Verticiella sp. GG226]MBU4609728.1 helix-turn-helix domain-containing protein [Verticiella sp. GG226]